MAALSEPIAGIAAEPPPSPAVAPRPLLEVDALRTWFFTRDGIVRAVDGVSLHVMPGETPYLIQLPEDTPEGQRQAAQHQPGPGDGAWYQQLWSSLGG